MVPHLVTALTGPINELEQRILDSMPAIERWFRLEWMEHTPPFYTSVDVRNSGFKLAPVDTNLFPSGWNNLTPEMLPLAVQAAMAAIEKICPEARNLLVVPENHTHNTFYLSNLLQLKRIFHQAGLNVRFGSLNPEIKEPTTFDVPNGESITIEPLIRLAVQQSNCFVITSIGNERLDNKMSAITDKQRNSGEYRAGSKQQKGQRVAADYFMEPSIIVDQSPTGRLAGALGGALLGGRGGQVVGAGMESKVSVVTLSLFDIRSSVQIAISEGNSTATNFGAALGAFGGGAAGGLGGFSQTPEGKATVAAFVDAYNSMVISLRNYKAQDVKGGLGRGGTLKVN